MDEHAQVTPISARREPLDQWITDTRVGDSVTRRVLLFKKIRQWWWFHSDRCVFCGGKLEDWSYKKASCVRCGKDN